MKYNIEFDSWERKDNFSYFKDFLNPFIAVTSDVDCSNCRVKATNQKRSFFLYYLYAILRAVNEIKELRYRIEPSGQIVLYDKVGGLCPIKMKANGKFYTVRISYYEDFEQFFHESQAVIQSIPEDGDPYAVENAGVAENAFDVVLVSAVPDLYFTSIVPTQKHRSGSDYPLITAGKAIDRNGKLMMPIALAVHHGFVDGFHISDFFRRIQQYLSEI